LEPTPPPERSEGVHARGSELNPDDLETLAQVTGACGGPWARDFLNEPLALKNGRAVRDGDALRVGEGSFVNPYAQLSGAYGPRDPIAWEYHYFGTYRGSGLDLIHVQYSEGNGYQLIDRATLTAVEFQSLPLPSPSGRYFAATSDSEMAFVGIEIGEHTGEGLQWVESFESKRYPCGLRWVSDTRIEFRELGPETPNDVWGVWREETRAYYRDAAVELRDGKWVYLPAN
jgi:hypothetical protein